MLIGSSRRYRILNFVAKTEQIEGGSAPPTIENRWRASTRASIFGGTNGTQSTGKLKMG